MIFKRQQLVFLTDSNILIIPKHKRLQNFLKRNGPKSLNEIIDNDIDQYCLTNNMQCTGNKMNSIISTNFTQVFFQKSPHLCYKTLTDLVSQYTNIRGLGIKLRQLVFFLILFIDVLFILLIIYYYIIYIFYVFK